MTEKLYENMQFQKDFSALQTYINKMPTFPSTINKVMEICNKIDTSPADLNKIISLDPVLMGNVLKLVNSAYYGMSQDVVSLVRAIIMLGSNTIKNLALSTAVLGNLMRGRGNFVLNMDEFWRHSLGVGVISKIIAKKRNVNAKQLEEYFIAGLLHDIGKLPLNDKISNKYRTVIDVAENKRQPLYISEEQVLQFNHAQVGKLIAETWNLGKEIIDVIAYHHSVETYKNENKDVLYTVVLANNFANIQKIGFSGDKYPKQTNDEILRYLGMTIEYIDDIKEEVNDAIRKAQIFLKVAQ